MKSKDPAWQERVAFNRKEIMRTFRDIRSATVDEIDLVCLQNFCQFALALMQMEGEKKWARAKVNAEIMSLIEDGK